MSRRICITGDDATLEQFKKRLHTDPTILQELETDPKQTFAKYGIEIDDDTANTIKQHLQKKPGGIAPAFVVGPTIAVAVAVGPAVAVAI
ncbi:hypothetical protein [Geomonas oryzae]|uniref:hypothetical protein n=1 Tax=Geomonas oryzae TaxID=2364273 RepID=UPI00100B46C2|nr:hypothetical protein [Geomonas oryzae]